MSTDSKKYEIILNLLLLYGKYVNVPALPLSLAVTNNDFKDENLAGIGIVTCVTAAANE